MTASAQGQVASTLRRAGRRLGLLTNGRRAAWMLLGGVLCLEAAFALRPHLPALGVALLVVAVGLFVGAALSLAVPRSPKASLVAEVLDARLGSGAALASAAEVLEGRHGRFAPGVLEAAGSALEGVKLAQLVPARLPAGLLLGCAAAALLPFLAPAGAAGQSALASKSELPTLLAPEALGGGAQEQLEEPGRSPAALAPVVGGEPQAKQPWDALPLDAIEILKTRLSELTSTLPPSGSSARGASGAEQASSELTEALESGDLSRVQAILDRLNASAAKGDRAAMTHLKALAEGLGAPGGGGGSPHTGSGPAPDGSPTAVAPVAGVTLDLPPAFAAACRRYF